MVFDLPVTIAIPTIGDNDFVEAALQSALSELPPDGEIIISDNASSCPDRLVALAAQDPLGRVRVLRQAQRLAMADNWNCCLRAARGAHFILLSDDDVLLPGFVRATLALLQDPTVGAALTRIQWINEQGRVFWRTPVHPAREHCAEILLGVFQRRRVVLPCATVFRTADLLAVGGYDAKYGNWADIHAWLAVGARYPALGWISDCLSQYRERAQSLTKAIDASAWTTYINNTLEFATTTFAHRAGPLRKHGDAYLAYMLADVQMKRLTGHDMSLRQAFVLWRPMTASLPWLSRGRLALKLIYLRLLLPTR